MIPVAEQIKWMHFPELVESPTAFAKVELDSVPNAMTDLLLQDAILQQAIERMPSAIDFWQKEPFLRHAIGIANFDPDEESNFGELMRLVEHESKMLVSPHMTCDEKASLSATVFHGAVKLRGAVDDFNREHGSAVRSVGFVLPEQVRFLQGQNINFQPQTPTGRRLSTRIWVPPSPGSVQYEVHSAKTNGCNQTFTTFWFPISLKQVGGKHERAMEVGYRSDLLIPELSGK